MWIIVWDETLVVPHVRWTDVYTDIIQGIGEVGISSAVIAFVLTEVLNSIMLVSEWIRRNLVEATKERQFAEGLNQGLKQGRAEGRSEGRSEGLADGLAEGRSEGLAEGRAQLIEEISDWEERRREAQERGEAFDESPPYLKN